MLDLGVRAPNKVDLLILRVIPDQIPGLVDPVQKPHMRRILNEHPRCLLRSVIVAEADAGSAKAELARLARGNRSPRFVEDGVREIGNQLAERRIAPEVREIEV